jgi:dTDP-4-dehydrorhamnose reductase
VRVLVTGAAGQLGRDVVEACGRAGDEAVAVARSVVDITDRATVIDCVTAVRPDVIVNAAAYTAVDACESNVDHALAVNGTAVGHLADAAEAVGAHLVHVSTDYVFDGRLDRPYREDDPTNPQSAYGRSKLVGEQLAGQRASVVRTSWVCGEHGANMVKVVMALAEDADRALAFVDDQRGCPTFTADLAPALLRLASDRRPGLFHVTNARAVTWFGFVQEVLATAGHDPARVRPITTAELDPPRPAPRPANSVLDNAAWRAAGYEPLRDFAEPLAELVQRLTRDPR